LGDLCRAMKKYVNRHDKIDPHVDWIIWLRALSNCELLPTQLFSYDNYAKVKVKLSLCLTN
jgi:hypothetical protein